MLRQTQRDILFNSCQPNDIVIDEGKPTSELKTFIYLDKTKYCITFYS